MSEAEKAWNRYGLVGSWPPGLQDAMWSSFLAGYAAGKASRTPPVWSKEPPKVAGLYMRKKMDDFQSARDERVFPNQLNINWTPSLWYGPIPEPE